MSLLDNASLVLTPNAYKESKLYSVIPSDGSGDFTATRATTATRVNADGLVDLVPYNLVQRSEEFENAAWTKFGSSVTANSTASPSGIADADTLIESATNATHLLEQLVAVTAANHTFSCYVKAVSGSTRNVGILFNLTGKGVLLNPSTGAVVTYFSATAADVTISNVGNGWFRVSVTALTAAITEKIRIYLGNGTTWTAPYLGDGTSGAFIWGAQLVEGTSARDYLRTETRLNIPRVDYSLGGCPNILLEPQRTNLALQSSSFDSATWVKVRSTITANATISPSGVQDADKIILQSGQSLSEIYQNITLASTGAVTLSGYAKKAEYSLANVALYSSAANSNGYYLNFDLNTGLEVASGAYGTGFTLISKSITAIANGWYYYTLSVNTSVTAIGCRPASIYLSSGTGNGTSGIFSWGAQIEAGAYATSYIPTTTASVTRNQDSITRNDIYTNGLITAAGGTWFVELRNNIALIRDVASQSVFINSNLSGTQDGFSIRHATGGSLQRLTISKWVALTNTTLFTTTTDTCKLAIKWNGSTADVFQNGVKVIAATAFTPTNMEFLVGNGADVPKYINEMSLFPTPLTDDQCIALTQ